jgi:hypothetical protein
MTSPFWTTEKNRQLQKLETAGLSAAQIAERLGTTRSAVIGRSARLRGLIFPSQVRRRQREKALGAARLRERKERSAAALLAMQRAIRQGTPRNVAVATAARAGATYKAIGDALGVTRQRVQQMVSRRQAGSASRRQLNASPRWPTRQQKDQAVHS